MAKTFTKATVHKKNRHFFRILARLMPL